MGFKIENIQSSLHGNDLLSLSGRIRPKYDSISQNDLNLEKKIPFKIENHGEVKVDLKSSHPVLVLLKKTISTFTGE